MLRRVVVLLATTLMGWWVVYGYHIPQQLVSGPYSDYSSCQDAARFLNNHYLTVEYHCENVV